MIPPFTLDGYRTTVGGLVERGYAVCSFHDAQPALPHLVLRHDIDQSIASARAVADLESAEGWRSTWFVLMRTEMYNPFSRAAAQALRAMAAAGHEIGLHLDATQYSENEIEAGAATECRMLEDIVGAPVRIVSFHRPAPALMGGERLVAGLPHTYMDRFTKAFGYCSDSRGEWRHGHPFAHPAVAERRALQLLTHAVWWAGPQDRDRLGRLLDVLDAAAERLDRELVENNEVWRTARETRFASSPSFTILDRPTLELRLEEILQVASDVPGEYWRAEHFRADLPEKWALSWLAEVESRACGYAVLSQRAPGHCHLHHLMVDARHRSQGIGGVLLATALSHARERGYRLCTLKVARDNDEARRFYERNGFGTDATKGGYVTMARQLS